MGTAILLLFLPNSKTIRIGICVTVGRPQQYTSSFSAFYLVISPFFVTFWGSKFEFPKSQGSFSSHLKRWISQLFRRTDWVSAMYAQHWSWVLNLNLDESMSHTEFSRGFSQNKEVFKTRAGLKERWVEGFCACVSCDHCTPLPSHRKAQELLAGMWTLR